MKTAFHWSALDDMDDERRQRPCDFPGCGESGEYPAPKSPKRLQERYYFCHAHVVAYNARWNYYADMDEEEAEYHRERDLTGWRPAWRFGHARQGPRLEDQLGIFFQFAPQFSGEDGDETTGPEVRYSSWFEPKTPEEKAVAKLELPVPFTLEMLKCAYKEKAKQCHPDLNPDNEDAAQEFSELKNAYDLLFSILEKMNLT